MKECLVHLCFRLGNNNHVYKNNVPAPAPQGPCMFYTPDPGVVRLYLSACMLQHQLNLAV